MGIQLMLMIKIEYIAKVAVVVKTYGIDNVYVMAKIYGMLIG